MKQPFIIALRLLLVACLAVYGAFASADMTGQGGLFAIEICANGAPATIVVDAAGQPVDPATTCRECAVCAQLAAAPSGSVAAVVLMPALYGFATGAHWHSAVVFEKPHTSPMPRGPPSVAHTAVLTACATQTDHLRGIGRPQAKDARV